MSMQLITRHINSCITIQKCISTYLLLPFGPLAISENLQTILTEVFEVKSKLRLKRVGYWGHFVQMNDAGYGQAIISILNGGKDLNLKILLLSGFVALLCTIFVRFLALLRYAPAWYARARST